MADRRTGSPGSSQKRKRSQSPQQRHASGADGKRPRLRSRSPPKQRKRPGASARITQAEKDAHQQRINEREREQTAASEQAALARGSHNVVTQHYNAVPQRGREWRSTASTIKNLRSYNNWVKSTLIQKFSPSPEFRNHRPGGEPGGQYRPEGLRILDIGCGKGGDLQKWLNAPQEVQLYVGVDPADVSLQQARGRHREMRPRRRGGGGLFRAEFFAQDAYATWLGDIPFIREVGICEQSAGSRWSEGGFDVVSMMFCMHYAFESEAKARMMLRNVAGSLRRGGRFIGVVPNSDVIRKKVMDLSAAQPAPVAAEDGDDTKSSAEARPAPKLAAVEGAEPEAKEPPSVDALDGEESKDEEQKEEDALEWGNELYKVRFPGKAPRDGIFRPPYGWKYSYFLEEAVDFVAEYVVPWEGFRALAEEFNLELQYRRPFAQVWEEEKRDGILGPLSVRMRVTDAVGGDLALTEAELDAVNFYHAFAFYKV